MKRFILFIVSVFIISFSFANNNLELSDLEENMSQIDTSKVNFYELQTIKLYPNPASDHVFIDYEIIFVKEAKLQIYNSIGAVVFSKELKDKHDKIKVLVSDFKNGLYFCSLQIDGKLLNTRKIIINH
jgi:type IX secretion system substrate protein